MTLETVKNDADYMPHGSCQFRDGLWCPKKERYCKKCGWNPEVERERIEKFREEREKRAGNPESNEAVQKVRDGHEE